MRAWIAFVLVALLASCGPRQQAKLQHAAPAKTQSADKDQSAPPPPFIPRQHDLRTFLRGSAPPEVPSYLPLYPDAKIVGGFERPSHFGAGGSVIYTSTAQPADIIAFYEKSTAAAKFTQTVNNASGATLNFEARAGLRNVQVIAQPIPGGSHVQIFWQGGR